MMVTAALSSGFDRLYPLRVLAVAAALLWFRRVYVRWDWGWSWPSVGIGGAVFILWTVVDRITMGDATTLGAGDPTEPSGGSSSILQNPPRPSSR